MADRRFNADSRANWGTVDINCFIKIFEAKVSHETNPTLKDKLGNDLLHDLGCSSTNGQHPIIAI